VQSHNSKNGVPLEFFINMTKIKFVVINFLAITNHFLDLVSVLIQIKEMMPSDACVTYGSPAAFSGLYFIEIASTRLAT